MPIETRKLTRSLPVALSPEEVAERADAAANLDEKIDSAKAKAKAEYSDAKEKIAEQEAHRKELQRQVREKAVTKSIECEERKDFDAGTVTIVRLDTGEIVSSDAMERSEQRRLDIPPRDLDAEKALDEEGAKMAEAEGAAEAAEETRARRAKRAKTSKRGKRA